jgi:hypothetical protein
VQNQWLKYLNNTNFVQVVIWELEEDWCILGKEALLVDI